MARRTAYRLGGNETLVNDVKPTSKSSGISTSFEGPAGTIAERVQKGGKEVTVGDVASRPRTRRNRQRDP